MTFLWSGPSNQVEYLSRQKRRFSVVRLEVGKLSTRTTGRSSYIESPANFEMIGMVPTNRAVHAMGLGSMPPPWVHNKKGYLTRNDINLDILIWLSESSLSGFFSEVSLIRDNQVREFKGNSLIIKGMDNQAMKSLIIKLDNQVFFTTSLPTFPSLPMIHRTKQMTG